MIKSYKIKLLDHEGDCAIVLLSLKKSCSSNLLS